MIFAAERNNVIIAISPELSADHAGQEWFRALGSAAQGATLVVLDLAEDESPSVGDAIDVDPDGVATLREDGDRLSARQVYGSWLVEDWAGGVWRPSLEADAEIEASEDPAATALRICREQPMRGEWHS